MKGWFTLSPCLCADMIKLSVGVFSFYRRSPGAHRPFSRTAGRRFVHLIGPAVEDFSIGCSAIWLAGSTLALYRPHLLTYQVTLGRYIATKGPVITTDGRVHFFQSWKNCKSSAPPGWCTHRKGGRDRGARTFSGWWFQIFFIFNPTWGRFPFWLIFFRWVETTN